MKPREWKVRESVLDQRDKTNSKHEWPDLVHVREVKPIDWRKIYEDLPITWPMALLEIRKRIEKQLAGEE